MELKKKSIFFIIRIMKVLLTPESGKNFFKYFFLLYLFTVLTLSSLFPLDPSKKVYNYHISKWDVENGLPQNSVMTILQTEDKYLWIGTDRGVARFDGVNFEIFNSSKYKTIRNNRTVTLLEDRKRNFYFGSRGGGLNKITDGKIKNFSKAYGLKDDFILSLFEGSNGEIWIGTFKGLSKMDINGKILPFKNSDKLDNKIILDIAEDRDGKIWIGTFKNGIFSISKSKQDGYDVKNYNVKSSIRTVLVDHNGLIWVGTNGNGLMYFKNGEFIPFSENGLISDSTIFSLFEDKDNNLWIGTAKGLIRFCSGIISKWPNSSIISRIIVKSIYEDHEGSLWVGTNNSGLIRLKNGKFDAITTNDGLSSENATAIFEDSSGGIWIGTDGSGLNYLKSLSDGITNFFNTANGMSSDIIYSIAEDINGDIWVGTNKGITIIDKILQKPKKIINSKNGLPNDVINVIFKTKDNSIWVGTLGGGIVRFSGEKITVYTTSEGLSNNFVHSIYEDNKGYLWIGTYGGGINRFSNGNFSYFNTNRGLSDDFIFSITGDSKGNIWIGSGGGLNRIHNGKIVKYNYNSPIFSDTIYNIFIVESKEIYLTSNIGLYKIKYSELDKSINESIKDFHYELFNTRDGLNSDECSGGFQPAGWQTSKGLLLIPTLKGVGILQSDTKPGDLTPPPVYIEDIDSDNPFEMKGDIAVFPGRTKKIDFHFTALSFLIPERVKFKVKVEGFDNKWIDVKDSRNRVVSYTNLSAGNYKFRVIASNSDGIWNKTGAVFKFRIKPLFYKSPAFFSIVGIFFVFLLFYIFRLRVHNIRKRESELQQLVDEQTKELRSSNIRLTEANEQKSELLSMAAHDLKNPLQAIIGFSELISLKKECPESIRRNSHLILEAAKGMLETINNTLNATVIREGKIALANEETIDLTQLSRLVVEIYSEFAKKKNQIVITRYWNDCYIKGDKERIKIVVENLLSNAIKYSPLNKNIVLSVERLNRNIVLSVKDEGSGFSEDDKKKLFEKFRRLSSKPTAGESSTGIGLSIVKKIVEMHHGKIWLESNEGEGAIFFVSFPAVDHIDTWKVK